MPRPLHAYIIPLLLLTSSMASCSDSGNDDLPLTSCLTGQEGCECYGDDSCDDTLNCIDGLCVAPNDPLNMIPAADMDQVVDLQPGNDMSEPDLTMIEEKEEIGPEGGTVRFGEGELLIPPGALKAPLTITVRALPRKPASGYTLYGSLYEFSPSGLTFEKPVTVMLPRANAPQANSGIFWSRVQGTGYSRLPTLFDGEKARADVMHFSEGFVGDDAEVPLENLPVDCIDVDVQPARSYAPAAVRASFVVRRCDGLPMIQELRPEHIEVINDVTGDSFNASFEGGGASSPARLSDLLGQGQAGTPSVKLYALLSLDLSNSIVDSGSTDSVIDAAQQLVDELVRDAPESYRYQVAIQIFGRSEATQIVQDFSFNYSDLTSTLDTIRESEGLGTTDLYGAYGTALNALSAQQGSADIVDLTMLVVTDGRHETGDFDNQRQMALSLRDEAIMRGVSVHSVAVNAPQEDLPYLEELATSPANFDAVTTTDQIREAFEQTSKSLKRLPDATYVVGICTPVALGEASFSVKISYEGVSGEGSVYYDTNLLDGDVASCDPAQVAEPCQNRNCGPGYLDIISCGGCQGGSCDASMCTCPAERAELCDQSCVAKNDVNHCGACGIRCDFACSSASMTCVEVEKIFSGAAHSCALLTDKTVQCWGENNYGQLGDGSITVLSTPVSVSGLTNVDQLFLGDWYSCALLTDKTVKCWGYNAHGQLGDGSTTNRSTPLSVSGLTNVDQLFLGDQHSCALLTDKTVKCWGRNIVGQVGDGSLTSLSTPVSVSGLTNVDQLSLGYNHSCALLTDKTVKCWGGNNYGKLGDGSLTNRSTPVSVSGLTNIDQLSLGYNHSCALLTDKTVKCWGDNIIGQLGGGSAMFQTTPVSVSSLTNVGQLSLGDHHSCALLTDKTVKCWGRNNHGRLGDGSTTDRSTPVSVSGLTNVDQLFLGDWYSCALLTDKTVKCWGYNAHGQLGDGSTTNRSTPLSVSGLTNVGQLSVGIQHSCALLTDKTTTCWGHRMQGERPDGTIGQSFGTPVIIR